MRFRTKHTSVGVVGALFMMPVLFIAAMIRFYVFIIAETFEATVFIYRKAVQWAMSLKSSRQPS